MDLCKERGRASTSTFRPTASAVAGETPGPMPPFAAPAIARCRPRPSPQNASSPKVAYRNVLRPSRTWRTAWASTAKSFPKSCAPALAQSRAAVAAANNRYLICIPFGRTGSRHVNAGTRATVPPAQVSESMKGGAMISSARSIKHASFTIERKLDFDPSLVFRAWTKPEVKARWFSGPPDKWTEQLREMDVRVGGRDRLD